VDDSRRTRRYFLDRCYAEGFSKAKVAKLSGMSSALSSERTYVIHAVQQAFYREFSGLCHTGSKDALGRLAALLLGVSWMAAGFVRGIGEPYRIPVAREEASEMALASMIHPVMVSKVASVPLAAILRATSCTCRSTRPTKRRIAGGDHPDT
jgi:hypothetical protein